MPNLEKELFSFYFPYIFYIKYKILNLVSDNYKVFVSLILHFIVFATFA